MKRILLIGYNYFPEPTGIGKYTGEMIAWMAERGYDCTVITAYPYYPYWQVQEPYYNQRMGYTIEETSFPSGGRIKVHRCPMYVPEKPSGLKRMLLDLTFLISAFIKLLQLLPGKRFDVVVTVVPSFQFGLLGILYKKLRGARLLYHIHDLQIEAARDLNMIRSKKMISMLFGMEKIIFNQCDVITCTGEGMVRKTREKAKREVYYFSNWTDIRHFYPLQQRELLKLAFGFDPSDVILLYSGAIGEKQGLESLIEAARVLENDKRLKFLICGSGPYKEKLEAMVQSLGLGNVIFYPLQPVEEFNRFLNMADVHLVIQKISACDLVMPSKLTTILSVGGLALITANEGSGLHAVVAEHEMGLLVEAENINALVRGIQKAVSEDHSLIKHNARRYAESHLAIDRIMGAFEGSFIQPELSTVKRVQPDPILISA